MSSRQDTCSMLSFIHWQSICSSSKHFLSQLSCNHWHQCPHPTIHIHLLKPKWAQTKQCMKYAIGPPGMFIIIIYMFVCFLTWYLIRSHCHPCSQRPALTTYYINVQIGPNDVLLGLGGLGQGLKRVLIIRSWKKLTFNLSIVVYVYYFHSISSLDTIIVNRLVWDKLRKSKVMKEMMHKN